MTVGLWAWVIILISIAVYDVWAWATRAETLTDAARRLQRRWRVFRFVVALALAVLWWHLFASSFR